MPEGPRARPASHGNPDSDRRAGLPSDLSVRYCDQKSTHRIGWLHWRSGAPVFDGDGPLVIGVVSWSTAPGDEEGCGGLTGVTPLLLYRDWIDERRGSPTGEVTDIAVGLGCAVRDYRRAAAPSERRAVAADGMQGYSIPETTRSYGALLVNRNGERFVDELAPRDVVAEAIVRECDEGRGVDTPDGRRSVPLDCRPIEPADAEIRSRTCSAATAPPDRSALRSPYTPTPSCTTRTAGS